MASKHRGCAGLLVIDTTSKTHHAPPLVEDAAVTARVERFSVKGAPLPKWSNLGDLGNPTMTIRDVVETTLYILVPVPGLLYLALAAYLREIRYKQFPERNRFAVVNGVVVATALGIAIGLLPGFLYVVSHINYMNSTIGDRYPNQILLIALVVAGLAIFGGGSAVVSYRLRSLFRKSRVAYYLVVLLTTLPLVSLAYLLADSASFNLRQ